MAELERGTSEWWLDRLGRRLASRAVELQRFDDYYRGRQAMVFASNKFRETFGKTFEHYAENYCALVVDAVEERLDVTGFRMGADRDLEADEDAWRIWQANALDANSQLAHVEALVKGVTYVLVSPFEAEEVAPGIPRITVEDALETIVELRPGSTERIVGMKRWLDAGADTWFATLYFPDRLEKWQADGRHTANSVQQRSAIGERVRWRRRDTEGETWPLLHDLGVVPLVPLVNRPRLGGVGESEIASVIPIQDAINKLAVDMLTASEEGAFPARWATGIEVPKDPETGKDLEPWKPGIGKIMSTAVPDARFGSFDATNLDGYVKALDSKVQAIASTTRTPYHYFLRQGGQPPSGESLRGSETGLVAKARRKHVHLGEGWEEVERLAFKARGDARGDVMDSETLWRNPETLTEAEHVDALTKLRALHVPLRQLWADAGYTPQQIARFIDQLREERALLADIAPPTTSAPPTASSPAGSTGG